jgi:hypothetical protein
MSCAYLCRGGPTDPYLEKLRSVHYNDLDMLLDDHLTLILYRGWMLINLFSVTKLKMSITCEKPDLRTCVLMKKWTRNEFNREDFQENIFCCWKCLLFWKPIVFIGLTVVWQWIPISDSIWIMLFIFAAVYQDKIVYWMFSADFHVEIELVLKLMVQGFVMIDYNNLLMLAIFFAFLFFSVQCICRSKKFSYFCNNRSKSRQSSSKVVLSSGVTFHASFQGVFRIEVFVAFRDFNFHGTFDSCWPMLMFEGGIRW